MVWPVLVKEVMVDWSSQSFETLNCLLEIQDKYPTILKKKQILSTFGTSTILHEETVENIQKMLIVSGINSDENLSNWYEWFFWSTCLQNITWEPCLKHPLYETIGKCLTTGDEDYELLDKFWAYVDNALNNSPTRLKILATFTIFGAIMKHLPLEKVMYRTDS